MFESLMNFINSRLEETLVVKEQSNEYGYFIFIDQKDLNAILLFLKNDPDLKLTVLDQIIALPSTYLLGEKSTKNNKENISILYQLKSLSLPYRVTVVLEIEDLTRSIPTISATFQSARWQEADISEAFNIVFEESFR